MSYDNTGALSANTWRHVAFIEQPRPLGQQASGLRSRPVDLGMPVRGRRRPASRRPTQAGLPLADVLRRVQALHARRLPRRLPDRRAVPHRVRHGGRAAGHLQRLRLLRARPARTASSTGAQGDGQTSASPRSARSATTGSATARGRPARRPARPSRSSSARSTSCASGRGAGRGAARGGGHRRPALRRRPRRRRRRRRRVLPAAGRAGGLRPATRPGRDDPGPAADVATRRLPRRPALLAGSGRGRPGGRSDGRRARR